MFRCSQLQNAWGSRLLFAIVPRVKPGVADFMRVWPPTVSGWVLGRKARNVDVLNLDRLKLVVVRTDKLLLSCVLGDLELS